MKLLKLNKYNLNILNYSIALSLSISGCNGAKTSEAQRAILETQKHELEQKLAQAHSIIANQKTTLEKQKRDQDRLKHFEIENELIPRNDRFLDNLKASPHAIQKVLEHSSTPHGETSIEELATKLSKQRGGQQDHLWGVSHATSIEPIITPSYDDEHRTQLPNDHSHGFLNKWKAAIESGKEYIDVTSLDQPEAGNGHDGFRETLISAISQLNQSRLAIVNSGGTLADPLRIRILFACIWITSGTCPQTGELLTAIRAVLDPAARIDVSVGVLDSSRNRELSYSWNHSKIVATEDTLVTGGHNLYNSYLLTSARPQIVIGGNPLQNPVHDVSMELRGHDVAKTAHFFADQLWGEMTLAMGTGWLPSWFPTSARLYFRVHTYSSQDNVIDGRFLPTYEEYLQTRTGSAPMGSSVTSTPTRPAILVGRLGKIAERDLHRTGNLSDFAILEVIRSTKHALFMAQQRIRPLSFNLPLNVWEYQIAHAFNSNILDGLAKLIHDRKHVFILTSSNSPKASGDGTASFLSGWSPDEARTMIQSRVGNLLSPVFNPSALNSNPAHREAETERLTNKFLHILSTANGEAEVPNHSKVIISDDELAYVGSSNVYDDSHAEFGVVVGKQDASRLLSEYFKPFWKSSLEVYLKETEVSEKAEELNTEFQAVRTEVNQFAALRPAPAAALLTPLRTEVTRLGGLVQQGVTDATQCISKTEAREISARIEDLARQVQTLKTQLAQARMTHSPTP